MTPQSPLNPRDFVELLDEWMRINCDHPNQFDRDRMKVIKRQLTDFLLDIDKRTGVYVKGENEVP